MTADRNTRDSSLVWIAGITILALLFRIINLNAGLWLDEIYSVVNQFRLGISDLFVTFVGDNQHPLYALLASASMSMFGEQPWVARLPAVVFGVATVPALYCLGKRAFSQREALLAAALLAVSYHHVWFSQNARGYTVIAFTAILCTDLFLRLMKEPRTQYVVLYGVVAALGCFAHLTMVFIVIAHFLTFLTSVIVARSDFAGSRRWHSVMAAFVLSGVLTLLLYAPIATQVVDYFVNQTSGLQGLSTHRWAAVEAIRSLTVGLGGSVLLVGALFMLLVGAVSCYRTNKLMLAVFVYSILVTFMVAAFARGTMYPRFFFFLIGFLILFGVRGVTVMAQLGAKLVLPDQLHARYGMLLATLAMVFVIAVSAATMVRNFQYPKMDFAGARQWVENHASEEDRIATAGAAAWVYNNYYNVSWPELEDAADIAELQRRGEALWVVFTFGRYLRASAPEVYDVIDGNCSAAKRFPGTLGGGDVVVCQLIAPDKRIL